MNRAQGGTRALPDGFLHVQNFTVTKASGIEGIVWQMLDDHQKDIVESILVERADFIEVLADEVAGEVWRDQHGTRRFRKTFLKENFHKVVREVVKSCWIDPTALFEKQWRASRFH